MIRFEPLLSWVDRANKYRSGADPPRPSAPEDAPKLAVPLTPDLQYAHCCITLLRKLGNELSVFGVF